MFIEYRSEKFFEHRESGLWYPGVYQEKTFDDSTGETKDHWQMTTDKSTLKLNQPIADEEFSIDVLEGATIDDNRDSSRQAYRATKPGTLTLAKDGLDLEKMVGCTRVLTCPSIPKRRANLRNG